MHGRSAKTVLYKYIWRTGPVRHRRGEDGVPIIYQEEGTRIARAECEDGATMYATLQMIENEWLCVIYMYVCVCVCVCVTLRVCWIRYCIW